MERTKPLLLIGAGGHAKVIAEIARQNNYHIEAIFADNNKYNFDKYVGRYDSNLFDECHLILAIGDNNLREKISQSVTHSFEILISKYAIVSNTSSIDKGTVVFHNSVIQADTKIGKHCIVNTNATIEHDCEIGNFVHIAPNACICGEVTIGDNTLIGANSTILPGIKIGKNCIVGAGSVVTKSIEDGTKVAGNPARIIN